MNADLFLRRLAFFSLINLIASFFFKSSIHLVYLSKELTYIRLTSDLPHSCLLTASQCPPLSEPANTNVTVLNGAGRGYGTIVRYECLPGYQRSGPPVVLCMSNGTWSGEVPTCSR